MFVTKPCVSKSVMTATCFVTVWIIGGGFVLCGPTVLQDNYAAWGASILLTLEVVLSFYKGQVTKSIEDYEGEGDQCKKCDKIKRNTTHHCSTCNICIDDLDHHCLFLNNCIGSKNMIFFLRFVFWVCIACYYVAGSAVYTLMEVQFSMTNITLPENKRLVAAFVLAFPSALLPAAAPTLGLQRAIILTVSMSAHIGAMALGLAKGSWGIYVAGIVVGLTVSKGHIDMFFNCSVGMISIILIALAIIAADGFERLVVILVISATGVAFLTSFLFVGSLLNVLKGVRTFESMYKINSNAERPKGMAAIKDMLGGDNWSIWKLFF